MQIDIFVELKKRNSGLSTNLFYNARFDLDILSRFIT